ncbi:Alpha/Beta hydrolase protein [Umbelopsis sp. PMI_123]|nr:Alpha/Beta hydrolase protein [Umbelopsis sp. PMI_123]
MQRRHVPISRQTRKLSTKATALVLLGVPTGVYLYKCFMMVAFQSKLIYLPYVPLGSRHEERTSEMSLGMDVNDVEVISSDKKKLRGVVINPSLLSGPVMIYFQGNAGNMNHRLPLFKQMSATIPNLTIAGICYRGFGSSLGRPSEHGLEKDAQAIFEWTYQQYPERPIFLYGHSLGGGVAAYLASNPAYSRRIRGVILENTYLSIQDMVAAIYTKWTPYPYVAKYLLWNRWPTKERIAHISCPVLFLSSAKDEIVPPEHMETLYRICKKHQPNSQIAIMPKSMHMDMNLADRTLYNKHIRQFITINEQDCS